MTLPVQPIASTADAPASVRCAHCGLVCPPGAPSEANHRFCCRGCQSVYSLLHREGLGEFYTLSPDAGVRPGPEDPKQFAFLDQPEIRAQYADFCDGRRLRATLRVPAIHCLACVWLLENLFRLELGFGASRVAFARRELAIEIDLDKLSFSRAATRLAELGYPPEFRLADLEESTQPARTRLHRHEWLRLGVAGFAFGNTMLFSLAQYLGMDASSTPGFRPLTGWLSLALAVPVVVYSAGDYWRASWLSIRQRRLAIEVPIAVGIVAIFLQSTWEVISGHGPGYFDSLAGLLFFLLIGRAFSRVAWDRLSFERDYKSFFPLAVTRRTESGDTTVVIGQLEVGDRVVLRPGDLVPADGRLLSATARIDYSFVTGEAEPVGQVRGDLLYAGGRQRDGIIEVAITKPVSQSYLTSLWDQAAFRKQRGERLDSLLNRYSPRFTAIILALAIGSALFWWPTDPARAVKAFVSVLIVACPCALALAAPFSLGTAQRMLARHRIFLRNPQVIEDLAGIDGVVLDKTGTLTKPHQGELIFHGEALTEPERQALAAMVAHSSHPVAERVRAWLGTDHGTQEVRHFREVPGAGIEATSGTHDLRLGSSTWFRDLGIALPGIESSATALLAVGGQFRGAFHWGGELRPGVEGLIRSLENRFPIWLLSGDRDREGSRWRFLFGPSTTLCFSQSPMEKLDKVRKLECDGRHILMVGDGLNDAGALRQSTVGIAVVEAIGTFSPASDVILDASSLPLLPEVLDYSKRVMRVVRICLGISTAYNLIGLTIAARGELQPVVCAILMPLSSVTVVAAGCGLATWSARKLQRNGAPVPPVP